MDLAGVADRATLPCMAYEIQSDRPKHREHELFTTVGPCCMHESSTGFEPRACLQKAKIASMCGMRNACWTIASVLHACRRA